MRRAVVLDFLINDWDTREDVCEQGALYSVPSNGTDAVVGFKKIQLTVTPHGNSTGFPGALADIAVPVLVLSLGGALTGPRR